MSGEQAVALALNSGSSSLKYAALDIVADPPAVITEGEVDPAQGAEAFAAIDHALDRVGASSPRAVGHRIVHGGPKLLEHCFVDQTVIRHLEEAEPFAPLHVPAALALLRSAASRYPRAAQIACFDTAFHAGMPDVARTLPIPRALRQDGLHRYGFHGLSCESIVQQLRQELPRRLIVAHLGNGASVTAILDGKSIDTSMGLTPTGGVIMGTRCGDIDPGVIIHLLRQRRCTASELETIVDKQGGMLGISGMSGDMRRLRASADDDAVLAIRMFCRSVSKQIAGMMAAMGGADCLVFTGGIGEHDGAVREEICADLAWAGVYLRDATSLPIVRECRAIVLPSNEAGQIAEHVRTLFCSARWDDLARTLVH